MALSLSDEARARGVALRHFEALGSTNLAAMEAARAGQGGPVWFVADMQEAGRGRRERAWASPRGNLYASLLLTDPSPLEKVAELCFVAALALDDALLALAPFAQERVKLKWPNDLLIDGAKAAGILIEATMIGQKSHAVIGMGVNIASFPKDTPYAATSLDEKNFGIDRDALFRQLSASMLRALDVWRRGEGFGAIRAGWIARAYGLGAPIVARLQDGDKAGLFAGLDAEGRLVLQTPDGEERIRVGEVFFGAAAP